MSEEDTQNELNDAMEKARSVANTPPLNLNLGSGLAPPAEPKTPASEASPGAVSLGNVAAGLSPSNQRRVAERKVISDEIPQGTACNLAFLGSGQGGSRMAASFHDLGYRRIGLFNTADSDFAGLPDSIERHIQDIGGAGKDAERAAAAIAGKEGRIWDLLERAWGEDVDLGLVCASLGGGTGSGTIESLMLTAKQYLAAKGKTPRVGALVSLPSPAEGQQVCRNAIIALRRITKAKASPILLIDNSKIDRLYRPGMSQLYNAANTKVSQLLNLFNILAATPSPLMSFDRSEFLHVLDHGVCVMGAADISNVSTPAEVSEAIQDQLQENVLADVDLSTGSKSGCLFVGDDAHMSNLGLEYFEAGFSRLNQMLQGQNPVVHRGVYPSTSPGLQTYAIVGGLKPPAGTLQRLAAAAKLTSGQLADTGLAKFLNLND